MRVLVTGATGLVGAAVLRAVAARGHETIAVVREGATAAPPRADRTVIWDLDRGGRPEALPPAVDAIVHAAQSRRYRAFPADAGSMFRVNVGGTWSLLDYAAATGVSRFCLVSSGTVYEPYDGRLDEAAAVAPSSFLGATKLAAEILAKPYETRLGLSVLRLFAPYGPGQQGRLVPDIISRVRTGKAVELATDEAGLWLTPTHVDDIASIVATAVGDGWCGTVNVASPQAVSLRQLAETIGELIGRRPIFAVTGRPPLRLVPPLDRLAERFDLAGFRTLREGLRGVIAAEVG